MTVEEKEGFIVFSDLKGFSKLDLEEQKNYMIVHVNLLSGKIKPLLEEEKAFVYNTWGDAIIAVFEDGMDVVNFMLSYRQAAKRLMPGVSDKTKVLPRIAGHYGKVNYFKDPLLDRNNTISDEVNLAARIEPITRPGEIFVSKEFKGAFMEQIGSSANVEFESLGVVPLAKSYGEHELYQMVEKYESKPIINQLFKLDLPGALPEEVELLDTENAIVKDLDNMDDRDQILAVLEKEWQEKDNHTGAFAVEIAEICKKAGLYQEGINWIEKAQKEFVTINNIDLYPYRTKNKVIQLQADLLTRLGRYKESAEILYSLWKNIEGQDTKEASKILSMLAAQFKRQAIIKDKEILSIDEVDKDVLKRAVSLYLEAFKYNFDDYYPAINAAYLLVILGDKTAQDGRKLAQYIRDTWGEEKKSSHWLDFTLAEAELVQGFYEAALVELKGALEYHSKTIGIFDIESTRSQIEQFLTLRNKKEEGQEIIELLDQHIEMKKGNKL